jgi:hypothetical protein
MLESIRQDSRYAARLFSHVPGISVATVLALALGIGAVTTVLSVVNTILLKALPYPVETLKSE